ncbi:thioredoxin-like protein [Aspergillus coremiiformis]|uniref:Thioredoxin-like protein n=1 Tax=Aspergillus coremiiformis TaxID=138285 RepID=A0A5N6Z5N8_9EURO|nr:thioredoxin-like protein [Aspergillus coremiiformis]
MSSAQDEFNRLVQSNREKFSTHPEDRDNSDHDFSPSDNEPDPQFSEIEHRNSIMRARTSTYHVPKTVFDANTGPKGVIADAQAFERARQTSFRKTMLHDPAKSIADDSTLLHNPPPVDGSVSEDDECFMRQWRESRIQELSARNFRRPSPRRRMYGSVDTVDAVGYLDAIEKVTSDTVVVVCIYDPESSTSALVEDCLEEVARRNPIVHFVKLHHEIAEMSDIEAPALVAYRGGEVFDTIVEIVSQIPKGRACNSHTLEDLLKQYRVL